MSVIIGIILIAAGIFSLWYRRESNQAAEREASVSQGAHDQNMVSATRMSGVLAILLGIYLVFFW